MDGDLVGLVAVVLLFGIPIVKILTNHHARLMEMKLRSGGSGGVVSEELRALKDQVADLRDTTTRYDISFDAALQRMESRMTHVEQKLAAVEQGKQSVGG